MLTIWTQHLKDPEDAKKFSDYVRHSKPIFERLQQIVTDEDKRSERSDYDESSYDTPNWSCKQAHRNGYRAALKYLQTIINLDQQK